MVEHGAEKDGEPSVEKEGEHRSTAWWSTARRRRASRAWRRSTAPEHGTGGRGEATERGTGMAWSSLAATVLPLSSRAQLRRTEERQDLKSTKRTFRSGWWHQPGPKGL